MWAGAAMACNIHMAQMKHCPFCAHGSLGQAAVMLAIILPQIFLTRLPWNWAARAIAALAMFPLMEGIAALILGWSDQYWTR